MKVKEMHAMNFNDAAELLSEQSDVVTTYEALKEFAITQIKEDRLFLAIHILDAIHKNIADYYDYDYCMRTLDTPTPLTLSFDLEDYCEDDEPEERTVMAHLNSLNGEMAEVRILEERKDGTQTVYIVEHKGVKCTAIFNPFVCEFYADDKYGIMKED